MHIWPLFSMPTSTLAFRWSFGWQASEWLLWGGLCSVLWAMWTLWKRDSTYSSAAQIVTKSRLWMTSETGSLIRRFRKKSEGVVTAGLLVLVGLVAPIVLLAVAFHPSNIVVYDSTRDINPDPPIHVLAKINDYDFMVVDGGNPIRLARKVRVCHTFKPQFEAGMTLIYWRYIDFGGCFEMKENGFEYHILKDPVTELPVLAPNCHFGTTHDYPDCDGLPDFSKEIS